MSVGVDPWIPSGEGSLGFWDGRSRRAIKGGVM